MIKTVSQVRVVNVKSHTYKSNFNQAELRQSVVKEYAARSIGNDMQSAFAPKEAYNLPNNSYQSERVCWVDIPKDWDIARAEAHLEQVRKNKDLSPCIYQVLSFEPILSNDDHGYMGTLGEGERAQFLETKKKGQMIINPSTGEIVTKANRPLFRKLFYSDVHKEDIDLTVSRKVSAVEADSNDTATSEPIRISRHSNAYATTDAPLDF